MTAGIKQKGGWKKEFPVVSLHSHFERERKGICLFEKKNPSVSLFRLFPSPLPLNRFI